MSSESELELVTAHNQRLLDELRSLNLPQSEVDNIIIMAQKRLGRILQRRIKELYTGQHRVHPLTRYRQAFVHSSNPAEQADLFFAAMIGQRHPVPAGLNLGRESESVGRGIQMCHGRIYQDRIPLFLAEEKIEWLTSNNRRDAQADFLFNVFSRDGYEVDGLGLYEYVLETNCSGRSDPVNFLNYLYNSRHMMTLGSKCIFPDDIILHLYRIGVKQIDDFDGYLIFRQRLIDRILDFCNYSMHDLVDAAGMTVPPTSTDVGADRIYTIFRV